MIIKFLYRALAFCLVVVIADQCVGFVLKKLYFHQSVGQFSQTTYAVDSARQDILVFGSSRAVRHYDAPLIAQSLGLSCYNSGRDGQMIPYATAVQEVSLNRHVPKLIVLDINPWELADNPSKYEKLSILLPYYRQHPELASYLGEISPFEKYKLVSKVYPYNSSVFILASNSLFPDTAGKDEEGYLPLHGSLSAAAVEDYRQKMEARHERIKSKTELPDEKAIGYYRKFLENTAKHQVKTLVIISPTILKDPFYLDNQAIEKKLVMDIAAKYPNVSVLDYSSDPRFNNQGAKFSDVFHLNQEGSDEFTRAFIDYIKTNHILE